MRRVTGLGLGLLALSACVAPRQAPPPPPPPPAPRPAPPPAPAPADWRDRPYSPGDWSYAGGAARYGALSLSCERGSGQIRLSWAGVSEGAVTVRTTESETVRQGAASASGFELVLPARDSLLDQIAFSRGRFMLAAGRKELILPAWPEITRVVEDCR